MKGSSEPEEGAGLSDIGQSATTNNSEDGKEKMPNWKERIDISIAKSRKIRGSNYVQISTINYETMEPRCRTVVFRGFLKGVPFGVVNNVLGGDGDDGSGSEGCKYQDCVMKMITDLRSNKVEEVGMSHEGFEGNNVEMVWWFPKSSEQYRIRGRMQFVGTDGPVHSHSDGGGNSNNDYLVAERKQQWGNLSDMAREQFYWTDPGTPFTSAEKQASSVPAGGRDAEGKVLPVPDTFLMMLLYPTKVDYLRLGDNYRQVDEWDRGGNSAKDKAEADADVSAGCGWKSMRVNP